MSPHQNHADRRMAKLSAPRYEAHPLADSHAFAFYERTTTNTSFDWHYHPELELIYWPTAQGIRMAGDSIESFKDGDLCLMGSNLPHTWSIHIRENKPERNIQVQFLPNCLGRECLGLSEMRAFGQLMEKARQGLKITGQTRQMLAEGLLRLSKDKPRPSKRFCAILEMLMDLAESRDCQPLAADIAIPSISPRVDKAVNKVLSFIQAHIETHVPQTKVAALLGMSPAAFSRFFRCHFGKTYVGFINRIRIGRACAALMQTGQTVAEIAYGSGFENLSHFNEQFRKYKCMSPIEYRQMVQEQFKKVC
ncbi:MAG: AraC family transcriptional regulator [Verrucomicrobiae bacterium]|nr:AraC family transcriptional regulator [Verrucomicrobiae bacterium]